MFLWFLLVIDKPFPGAGEDLCDLFDVKGVPTLVIVHPDGKYQLYQELKCYFKLSYLSRLYFIYLLTS